MGEGDRQEKRKEREKVGEKRKEEREGERKGEGGTSSPEPSVALAEHTAGQQSLLLLSPTERKNLQRLEKG
jgi:hypothetical protein